MTEKQLKDLRPKEKRYKVYLGDNLLLEIMPSGKKYFRKKIDNTLVTLGSFQDFTLRDARFWASDTDFQKQEISLFKNIADEWIAKKEHDWTRIHIRTVVYRLNTYIYPHLAKKNAKEITRLEILNIFRPLEAQGKIETCRRCIGIIKQAFDYGIICGYCDINPATGLISALRSYKTRPMPAFTNEEDIRRLMISIHAYHGNISTKNLMLFTAYTFCRPSECRMAKWSEIDGNLWVIPAERMKMKKEHIVPLSRQCTEIIETMQAIKKSEYIFPALRSGRPLTDATCLVALRTMGFDREEMTIHGFRAMASTTLNTMGYRPDIIEKALAHGDKDKIRAIYNRADYLEERRAMMQAYSDWLDNLT